MKDPILEALARIEAKQDDILNRQNGMEDEIKQIHRDTRVTAATVGGASGALAGGIIATAVAFARAKFGL